MTIAAGQNRRAHRIRRTGVGAPDNPTPDAPTAPSPVTAATPAATVMGWGGGSSYGFTSPSEFTTIRSWGVRATSGRMSSNYLFGFGSGQQSKGSTAAGDSGSQWDWQKAFEGLSSPPVNGGTTGLGQFKAKQAGTLDEVYLNVKLTQSTATTAWGGASTGSPPTGGSYPQETKGPPFGDWWDDTRWASVCAAAASRAAFVNFMGGSGLNFDPEDNTVVGWRQGTGFRQLNAAGGKDYGKPTGGHTFAEQKAKVEQRGYEFFSAIYAAFPNCHVVIYQWEGVENSWPVRVGIDKNSANFYADPTEQMHNQFFWGGLRAHADANSQGRFLYADAWWYRGSTQYSGSNIDIALKWESQGPIAALSRQLSAAVRNQALPYFGFTPMSWVGTDNSSYYNGNQETQPNWTNYQEKYRRTGMHGFRVEYNYDGTFLSNAAFGLYAGTNNYTAPAGRLAAWTPTMSTTDNYSNVAPTVAGSASGSGSTRTVNGTASHPLGIHYVKVQLWHAGAVTSTVVASMTWNLGGGSITTNIDNSYMDWTSSLTGVATGDYVIVTAYSIQNQQKSTVIGPL